MPAEFLRDVVRPPIARRSLTWSVLPFSIAAHAAGAVALLIIPLAAEEPPPAPAPASRALAVMEARPVPPPSARRRVPAARGNPNAAPLKAPPTIETERTVEHADPGAFAPAGGVGVMNGVEDGVDFGGAVLPPSVAPPPPPLQVRQVFRPGGDIREPKKIFHVSPVYPAIALNAGVQGVVILEATINETGTIENVRVLRSHPLLERAAVEAVKQWRYTPTRLNGQPVPIILTITVNFMIER